MKTYTFLFQQVDRSSLSIVGGKGANLGELSKAGFPVPAGFCVTTHAYQDFIATSPQMERYFELLNRLDPKDLEALRVLGKEIRTHLQQLAIPAPVNDSILNTWEAIGNDYSYAVRSSATAEDLPTASFAGQQDTYLNIRGEGDLLEHIRKCWASLFTDRAIAYRTKNGFDHRHVYLSVVVQRMVHPEIAGILFTVDPQSGNRRVVAIDASFGLGEAIVSGIVSADLYKVKANRIIEKNIAEKKQAVVALPEGGTVTEKLPQELQKKQVLTDEQILDIARLGKEIEAHFGSPQDIEFCVEKKRVYVVQSRPITSLYPLPDIPPEPLRVLISFGHIQMMTHAMKPLGLSVLRTMVPQSIFLEAGGRLYVDLTEALRLKLGRRIIPNALVHADEGISRAVKAVIQRHAFRQVPPKRGMLRFFLPLIAPIVKEVFKNLVLRDPRLAKDTVEAFMVKKQTQVRQSLAGLEGAERLEAVQAQLSRLMKDIFQNMIPFVLPSMITSVMLKKALIRWMGDDQPIHTLNKSLPGNVTSEMGLTIGDLADHVRNAPEVEAYLKQATDASFYEGLSTLPGGEAFKKAFADFIAKYGSRCPGEIDITNSRWREAPTQLVSAILGHKRSVKPGEHRQKYQRGAQEAQAAAQAILEHVKGNRFRSKLARRMIDVYRHLGGLREHHKYLMTIILDECKQAILAEGKALVEKGVLTQVEDVDYLTLEELIQLIKGKEKPDLLSLIAKRKEAYQWQQTLNPPRVMTSEGERITSAPLNENVPDGALIGSPVSAGVVEGNARIVLKPEEARLHEGDILVAPHTDPGWTPLFQSAKALITEVGGLMTHGSVVAREYGIPAVVGVDDATKIIKDGQRIRVDGDRGIVEILGDE